MKIKTSIILISSLLCVSCQNKPVTTGKETFIERTIASKQYPMITSEAPFKLFTDIMNEKTDKDRIERFSAYLKRQVSFYYIAQEYLHKFDTQLEILHKKKIENNILKAEDKIDFEKIRFQNIIAWEFNERNQDELLEIYRYTLIYAHDDKSPFQRGCKWILARLPVWLQRASETEDQLALMSLTEHLHDMNLDFKRNHKNVNLNLLPDFKPYFNLTPEALVEAKTRAKVLAQKREKTGFDSYIETKWTRFLEEREDSGDQKTWFDDDRTPQALDVLEPDPGSKGHVTGNRFPQGKWAMTYDDGPNVTHTPNIFQNLKTDGVHATFFWQAQYIVKYPSLIKSAKDLGFSRALHSYTHANLPKLDQGGLDKEINKAAADFTKIVGEKPTLFRCPYGSCGPMGSKIRQMIATQKMLHIAWNVDTLDWQDKNPDSIFERTKKQVDVLGRGIILFHDIHSQSVIASQKVIKYLKTKYKVEPLNKLIEESRGAPYYSP